jgi:hypothetical protein
VSSFRKPFKILREGPGSYVNGVWVPGTRSVVNLPISCQPAQLGKDLAALPQGRHLSDYCKIYSAVDLNSSPDGQGTQPDIVVHEGYGYEVASVDPHRSGVINHYKFLAVRVFKFTTEADWLSGALKRP